MAYSSSEELPGHNVWRKDLNTGEIRITLRAETPVFVSDGGNVENDTPHFFRTPKGEYAIPGSTVRGMIRENMQILGFGLIRPGEDLDDYQVYFRGLAKKNKSVNANAGKYYMTALNVQTKRSLETGKTFSKPENVSSGYLYRENGSYLIRPTKEPYYRVSRRHRDVQQFGNGDARVIPVSFTAADGKVKEIYPRKGAPAHTRQGMLLFTGRPVGNQNPLYLFPEPDYDGEVIPLSSEDELSFRVDFENRRNALKGLRPKRDLREAKEWLSFWQLPEKDGESKPVFFVRHEGHLYLGMSAYPRIGYPYSLANGIPERHARLQAKSEHALDYPHAILGFAENGKTDHPQDAPSFRSRVTCSDFTAEPGARETGPVSRILGEPKPSYYPGYLRDGRDYTQKEFELRGYKQYWLQDVQSSNGPVDKGNVASTLRPLPKGTGFHGTVRFRNLTDEELGLLLWCLRLEEGCFQTIGMGKPYGYGRMKLNIDRLVLLNPEKLYGDRLESNGETDRTKEISDFIRKYDRFVSENIPIKPEDNQRSIMNQPEIKDFFYMKRSIRSGPEISYMDLSDYQNMRSPLPSVEAQRHEEEKQQAKIASAKLVAEDPVAALKKWFKPLG